MTVDHRNVDVFYSMIIESFMKLLDANQIIFNWSEGIPSQPTREQIEAFKSGLDIIKSNPCLSPPKVMLLNDGTIGVYWCCRDLYVSIDFDSDGKYPWVARNNEVYKSGTWEVGNPFPEEIINTLR